MSLPNQTQEISPMEGQQYLDNQTVGLVDSGNSSYVKPRKQRSGVWKHFEKYRDEHGKDWAKCNLCAKVFDGSSKKGTTHLRNHFNSCQRKRNGSGGEGEGEGEGKGGDKPAEAGNITSPIAVKEKSGMVEQLNRLDMARKFIRGCDDAPPSIEVADIMDVYDEEKEKLRKRFEKLSCRFCLTFMRRGNYCFLAVHFIDDDWKLKKNLISVIYLENNKNLMKCVKNELLELGIDNKVSSMVKWDGTLDECAMSSNERENWFSGQGSLLFDSKLISINSVGEMTCRYKSLLDKSFLSLNFSYLRIWWVLNYITETSSKSENFWIAIDRARSMGQEVKVEVIPTKLQLEKMYPGWLADKNICECLLKAGLGLKDAFFELENIDPEFKSINLTKEEWDQARLFYESYQELFEETFVDFEWNWQTANMQFPMLCSLYTNSHGLAKFCFEKASEFIQYVDKCWGEYKLILTVAAVLDPRFKVDVVKYWYEKIYGDECEAQFKIFMNYFTDVYNEYAKAINNFKSCTSRSEKSNSLISYKLLDPSGKLRKSSPHLNYFLNSELHLYLEEVKFPRIKDFNILEWWRDNTWYFPTLARLARDFLSIQISAVDYEFGKIYKSVYFANKKFYSETRLHVVWLALISGLGESWECE